MLEVLISKIVGRAAGPRRDRNCATVILYGIETRMRTGLSGSASATSDVHLMVGRFRISMHRLGPLEIHLIPAIQPCYHWLDTEILPKE